MESRILSLLVVTGALLLLDYYIFQAVKTSFDFESEKKKRWLMRGYWFIVAITIAGLFLGIFLSIGRVLRTVLFVWFFVHYFSKAFALPFLLIDDLRRSAIWLTRKLGLKRNKVEELEIVEVKEGISRSEFISKTGLVMAGLPFVTMNYGMISNNVYDYQVKRKKIIIPNLPKSFDGIKIGQISDVHSGSFFDKLAVQGGVDLLNAEKCDIVFFTGDLVNDQTAEMKDYTNIFDKVKAPMGVYSILGNHDYGDYKQWPSVQAKKKNLEDLYEVHKNLGWDLLLNENRIIEQSGDKIAIVGVENWGSNLRFPRKGDLVKAKENTEEAAVKLLLSHDPSHWRAQVLKDHKDIDMMFAGHTHGMQFGIEFGDFKWSPAQYVYPEWSGLYEHEKQKLYVNVGYGFLGYPGRIGILPEITVFELKSA
ncbi:MAG: metallophosphoesterase [bacterium]|jgi:predicted MPP superfamily phosphohydrolase